MASGDAGEIAESPRGKGKELLRVLVARDLIDERVSEHVRQMADRRELGVCEGRLVRRAYGVDYSQFHRAADVARTAADPDRTADRARLFQREREGAADQADAHDHQLPDARHQPSSAVRSALRNLWFSLGVPTVTRRCSGMS